MEFTVQRFTDGRPTLGSGNEISCCCWDADAPISEDQSGAGESAVIMTWRYQLLGDGHRLRATEQIRSGGRDQDNVWEFERQ